MEFEYVELEKDSYSFQLIENDELQAEISWTMLGNVMVMDSTFVTPELRSQGVAKQLLDRAAQYARENDYKMEPICSYVVAAFNRYKEYEDLSI